MDAARKRKKKTMNNTRRFSEEQIRSLESMFGNETRLGARKKVELARELGLQPRQVAIWFQNKRARWKSKQLEREYGVLRANYNTLASRFGDLKQETQALLQQLEKLKHVMHKSQVEEGDQFLGQGLGIDGYSDNGNKSNLELEIPSSSLSKESSEQRTMRLSDEDMSLKAEYLGVQVEEEEEAKLVGLIEPGQSSFTSPLDWGNLDLNPYMSSYQWWDLWS